eukprot:CAMPEP_0197050866 /NCGR_PEP_ID=MMETSP1384-20130603/25675_1 /TAXON_ID=29189 /ORGANISM="Ammonia sp." /LENGTH=127 /DNA_ID=CAMNT_0042483343 /DNA_START=78 /DNA_END=458 /DNA_ORIENTATION=+
MRLLFGIIIRVQSMPHPVDSLPTRLRIAALMAVNVVVIERVAVIQIHGSIVCVRRQPIMANVIVSVTDDATVVPRRLLVIQDVLGLRGPDCTVVTEEIDGVRIGRENIDGTGTGDKVIELTESSAFS